MFKTFILVAHPCSSSMCLEEQQQDHQQQQQQRRQQQQQQQSIHPFIQSSIHPPGLAPIAHLLKGVDVVTNPPEDLQVAIPSAGGSLWQLWREIVHLKTCCRKIMPLMIKPIYNMYIFYIFYIHLHVVFVASFRWNALAYSCLSISAFANKSIDGTIVRILIFARHTLYHVYICV